MKLLAWDIETRPHEVYRWGFYDQSPVSLSQVIQPGGMISFAARWIDAPKSEIVFSRVDGENEDEMTKSRELMLGSLYSLMDEADGLVSWNGQGFDTKIANTEFIQLGWAPYSEIREVDLMRAVKKRMRFPSNKLEYVANALLGKGKATHEGFGLWTKCLNNDPKAWARMERYNKQDVHLLVDLYERLLPWLDTVPNRNLFDGYDGCPRCGSDNVQRRGSRITKVAKYARYQCQDCGGWASVGKAEERTDIR
jgi:DNA polymerase elongation subunit (family B)